VVLQARDGDSNASPGVTNGSTQHERNVAFPASFAFDWDTDTIGLVVLIVAVLAVFIATKLRRC
jgi:hypothetical protein